MLKICTGVRSSGKQLSLEAVTYISAHTWAVFNKGCFFAMFNDKRKVTQNINMNKNNINRFCKSSIFVLNKIYTKAASPHLVPLVKDFS